MMYTYDNTYTDASLTAVSKPCGQVVARQLAASNFALLPNRRAHFALCHFASCLTRPMVNTARRFNIRRGQS